MRRTLVPAVLLVFALVVGACGSDASTADDAGSTSTTAAPTEVTRVVWGEHVPPNAPDQTMTLYEVTIPAGAVIDPHVHPGLQIGRITSGELTYEILEGTVFIRRAGSDPDAAPEQADAGTTVILRPGDTVEELDGMVHRASNQGDEPVVVIASALVPTGDAVSVPVDVG